LNIKKGGAMFWNKKVKKTTLEEINDSTIVDLIDERHGIYLWDVEETKAVLLKCETFHHYVSIYANAAMMDRQPRGLDRRLKEGVIDALYFEVCKRFSIFIKDETLDRFEYVKELKSIYKELRSRWRGIENSPETDLLRARVCARWREVINQLYRNIKNDYPGDVQKYIELFGVCKSDDEMILIIAEEINNLT